MTARYTAEVVYAGETHIPHRDYGMAKAAAVWAGLTVAEFVRCNPDDFDAAQRDAVLALLDALEAATEDDFHPESRLVAYGTNGIVVHLLPVGCACSARQP